MQNYNFPQNFYDNNQYFNPNNQGYSYQRPSFDRATMEYGQLPRLNQNNS